MKELEKISQELFDKIRSRFENVSLGDENAKSTTDAEKARFFNFDYTLNGENYGNVTVSIADDENLKVYYSRNITDKIPDAQRPQWYEFLKSLRFFAKRNMMMFDTRDISRSSLRLRDVKAASNTDGAYVASDLGVTESKMYGTRNRSFQEMGPVKIMVRHSAPVNDEVRGSRSRHIESVFVETAEGERFKLPFTHLTGARAMARHMQNGGSMQDPVGCHIAETVKEMSDMRSFVRNTRGRLFEDDETTSMVESAIEYYGELHERLHKLKGSKSYHGYVGSYQPETDDATEGFDEAALRERFTRKMFDERMGSALSTVYKAHMRKQKQVPETAMGNEFADWADQITGDQVQEAEVAFDPVALDKLFQDVLPLGVDGSNAIAAISDIIDDESLADMLNQAAQMDSQGDARDEIYNWIIENRPDIAAEMDKSGQAVDESLRSVNGGFPFDVDHMPGRVIRQEPTQNIYSIAKWRAAANTVNKDLLDDNGDWISNSKFYILQDGDKVLAYWNRHEGFGAVSLNGESLKDAPGIGEEVDRYDQQLDFINDVEHHKPEDLDDDGDVIEIRKLAGL